jgi:hypothetical protein
MLLAAPERLRVYRRCFHELEEQLSMMQAVGGRDASGDVRKLQAELRSLEELIMIFTDLNPAAPTSKQSVSHPPPSPLHIQLSQFLDN